MLQNSLKIYLVNQDNFIYNQGYNFARERYSKFYKTICLPKENDYGVVIFWQNTLVGNLNLQLKQTNKLLKSEELFGQQHWQAYFQANSFQVGEMSALTISKKMPMILRQGTIIALSFGFITLLNILGIKYLTTIQFPSLSRIFNQTLNLPFFENTTIKNIESQIFQHYYWYSKDLPKIYYLNLSDSETIKTSNSFLSYLSYLGISTSFIPTLNLTNSIEPTYFNFRQYICQSDNSQVLLQDSNKLPVG